MKNTFMSKKSLLMLVAILGFSCGIQAQDNIGLSAITSFGGDGGNYSGTLSISGGQIVQETSIAQAITVVNITESFTEGVQQPYTIRDVQRENINPLAVNMAVYPNPTTTHVILSCNQMTEPLTYTLFSANGQMLQNGTYTDGEEIIRMEELPAGNYMLQVASSDKTKMNVYKIIKAK